MWIVPFNRRFGTVAASVVTAHRPAGDGGDDDFKQPALLRPCLQCVRHRARHLPRKVDTLPSQMKKAGLNGGQVIFFLSHIMT